MRFFTAIELSDDQREQLADLRGSLPGATWVPPANYHLTLRFLGEITSRHQAEEIDLALSRVSCASFPLSLCGTGLFSGSRLDRLWIGVARCEALMQLQSRIETALRRAGLPPEKRRFQPHVTIAHMDPMAHDAVARWMQNYNLLSSPPVLVTSFTLFESLRGPDTPVYEPSALYPLDAKANVF
ncbi:RNA 2',3'-cyclic phosphodiesterase [Tanticharoenia sakaeratensis]|uniref:RNA 2',3'-cyclic phosphodiesterase n=1 Tax=Tanticharoenia sakaeratensis NBRC 103193 TaxID=1231623 RepID=A0A0D6MKB9_9PROT|nr:RNA 2',3'-cyclic phosphodiesterase [Tanticharoenia sakaeratensis]GAN53890.1 2'-5' RNA ligase [Tanticharoenia sakaeratensis NBRC 103193]GBQ25182.1 2'-5' RNA ligase [Tanticharoenia sakaeratensis NBRC 103193]